jgi:hypothetical protein
VLVDAAESSSFGGGWSGAVVGAFGDVGSLADRGGFGGAG